MDLKVLHTKIEVDAGERFFGRRAQERRFAQHKAIIDREHDLPVTCQAQLRVIHKFCSNLASSGQSRVFQYRILVHDQSMLFSFLGSVVAEVSDFASEFKLMLP